MDGVIVGTVGSLLCLAGCIYFTWRSVRRLRCHHRADAEVVRYRCYRSDGRAYHPVLRFRTASGDRMHAISPYGSSDKPWRLGSSVRVTYDPADPRRAEIIGFGPLWLAPLAFAVFAALCAFAAYSSWQDGA